jgi:hypothetical protein
VIAVAGPHSRSNSHRSGAAPSRAGLPQRVVARAGHRAVRVPAVPVALPRELALAALAAWRWDEAEEPARPETPWQATVRGHAANLALIGLAAEEQADLGPDPVTVRIDTDLIRNAVAAARHPPGDLLTWQANHSRSAVR